MGFESFVGSIGQYSPHECPGGGSKISQVSGFFRQVVREVPKKLSSQVAENTNIIEEVS